MGTKDVVVKVAVVAPNKVVVGGKVEVVVVTPKIV